MLPRIAAARCRSRPVRPRRGLRAACPGADPCPYSAASQLGQRAEGVMRFPQAVGGRPRRLGLRRRPVHARDPGLRARRLLPARTRRRRLGPGRAEFGRRGGGRRATAASTSPTAPTGSTASRADGTLLNSWGKSGDGPGEFRFGAGGGNDSGAGGGIAIGPTARSTSPTRATTACSASPPTAPTRP